MTILNILTLLSLCVVFANTMAMDIEHRENDEGAAKEFCEPNSDFDFDCGPGELRTHCISALWHCDYIYDCTTGQDEVGCNYLHKCKPGEFLCRNSHCLLANVRCNGHDDCGDGSDERACPKPPQKDDHQHSSDSNNMDGESRAAEAAMIVDIDGENESASGIIATLMIILLPLVLLALIGFFMFRRYPDTASRIDQTLKDFGRSAGSAARDLTRSVSRASRVTILSPVPGPSSAPSINDQQLFFDNPMNTLHQQQPLQLHVQSPNSSH